MDVKDKFKKSILPGLIDDITEQNLLIEEFDLSEQTINTLPNPYDTFDAIWDRFVDSPEKEIMLLEYLSAVETAKGLLDNMVSALFEELTLEVEDGEHSPTDSIPTQLH